MASLPYQSTSCFCQVNALAQPGSLARMALLLESNHLAPQAWARSDGPSSLKALSGTKPATLMSPFASRTVSFLA